MIAIIATLYVQPEKTETFETRFLELVKQVKANEQGAQMYQLTKTADEPGVYKVMEIYADQAALDAHGQTDYFKAFGREAREFMAGAPKIERLETVG